MINDNIKASLCIGSYLDTLGFKNGSWEFNFGTHIKSIDAAIRVTSEIISHYYSLGGSNIDISKWLASDDTIMMISVKKAILNGGSDNDYINEFLKILNILEDKKKDRGSGFSTLESLNILKKKLKLKYSSKMGGNGAAMRTAYIGLHFYKDSDLNKLIHHSIFSSRLTHNYIYGFLGGYVTALFCSFGLRKIDPFKWSELLIDTIPYVDKYMESTDINIEYKRDKNKFWDLWYKYNEERLPFFEFKTYDFMFIYQRLTSLIDYEPAIDKKNPDFSKMGASGIGVGIYAYDSLLASYDFRLKEFNFESLVYYSTLHTGDNDTIGIIAGNWYGAFNGFKGFNQDKINMLEFKNNLI